MRLTNLLGFKVICRYCGKEINNTDFYYIALHRANHKQNGDVYMTDDKETK